MSKIQTQILESFESPVNSNLSNIYKATYKIGPVTKDINFTALSLESAKAHFEKFILTLKNSETQKVVAVGVPKAFAVDLNDEIEKILRRNSTDGRIGYNGL